MIFKVIRAFRSNKKKYSLNQSISEREYMGLGIEKLFIQLIGEGNEPKPKQPTLAEVEAEVAKAVDDSELENTKYDSELKELQDKYTEVTGKNLSPRYINDKEWLKEKIAEAESTNTEAESTNPQE